jgi:hypothetical protein
MITKEEGDGENDEKGYRSCDIGLGTNFLTFTLVLTSSCLLEGKGGKGER